MDPKEARKLNALLPELEQEGLISADQAEAIADYLSGNRPDSRLQVAQLILGVVAVLLISGGILLVFAYQWKSISPFWRRFISFLPALVGGGIFIYGWLRKRDKLAWREGASLFASLTLGATLTLVALTYELEGEEISLLLAWLVGCLPFVYLLNSSLVTHALLIGWMIWAGEAAVEQRFSFWLGLASLLPQLYRIYQEKKTYWRWPITGWVLAICVLTGWLFFTEAELGLQLYFGTGLLFSLFYLIELPRKQAGQSWWLRPLQKFAFLAGIILLLIGTYEQNMDLLGTFTGTTPTWVAYLQFAILGLMVAAWLLGVFRALQKRALTPEDWGPVLFPLIFGIYIGFYEFHQAGLGVVWANLVALGFGLWYLRLGILERRLVELNIGLITLLALLSLRFFDAQWSDLIKGTLYILLGCAFLATNWYLARKWNE